MFWLITLSLFLPGSPQGFHARQRETDLERQSIATIGRLKQSVAPIVCRGTSPSAAQATVSGIKGTGFFLAENGMFLTAAHVLRRLPSDATCQQPAIYLPTNNWATDQAEAPIRLFDFNVAACVSHEALDLGRCQTITDLQNSCKPRHRSPPCHARAGAAGRRDPSRLHRFSLAERSTPNVSRIDRSLPSHRSDASCTNGHRQECVARCRREPCVSTRRPSCRHAAAARNRGGCRYRLRSSGGFDPAVLELHPAIEQIDVSVAAWCRQADTSATLTGGDEDRSHRH